MGTLRSGRRLPGSLLTRYGLTAAVLIAPFTTAMLTHVHISLFVLGVRTSTWAMLILFANLALYRRRLRPLIAGFVWLVGFEAAWLITLVVLGRPGRLIEAPLLIGVPVFGSLAVWYASRRGLNVNLPLAAATAVVWLVWLGTGFHFNEHTTVGLNVTDEVLNETAKTLWALAYFVPLLRKPRWLRTAPALTALESCGIHGRGQAAVIGCSESRRPPVVRAPASHFRCESDGAPGRRQTRLSRAGALEDRYHH